VKGVEFLFDLENLFYEALFGIVFVIPALRLCIRLGLPQALTLVLWPTALILRRLGHSWLWTLVWFVPVANIVGFWMIAFRRWPGEGSPPPPKA
jgi:hypothetical protein